MKLVYINTAFTQHPQQLWQNGKTSFFVLFL